MNAILGSRIRLLRESKGLTQEQMAEKMNCTRQKYVGIEKGLIDISYASIISIANILGISADEITSVINILEEDPLSRKNSENNSQDQFEFITQMIDTFYAHRRLYNSVRKVDEY